MKLISPSYSCFCLYISLLSTIKYQVHVVWSFLNSNNSRFLNSNNSCDCSRIYFWSVSSEVGEGGGGEREALDSLQGGLEVRSFRGRIFPLAAPIDESLNVLFFFTNFSSCHCTKKMLSSLIQCKDRKHCSFTSADLKYQLSS